MPSELWVVAYHHTNGKYVVYGLYEDENEANAVVNKLHGDKTIAEVFISLEPVYLK